MNQDDTTTEDTLAALRKRAGLTQVQLAYLANVSITTISAHEKHSTWPRANDAKVIRDICNAEIAKAGAK